MFLRNNKKYKRKKNPPIQLVLLTLRRRPNETERQWETEREPKRTTEKKKRETEGPLIPTPGITTMEFIVRTYKELRLPNISTLGAAPDIPAQPWDNPGRQDR